MARQFIKAPLQCCVSLEYSKREFVSFSLGLHNEFHRTDENASMKLYINDITTGCLGVLRYDQHEISTVLSNNNILILTVLNIILNEMLKVIQFST